jgi:hypothetical protein
MKASALIPTGRGCRVEDAALAMLAGPGRMPGPRPGRGSVRFARRWSVWRRDIKPAPAPATTDDKPPDNHEHHDLRLEY